MTSTYTPTDQDTDDGLLRVSLPRNLETMLYTELVSQGLDPQDFIPVRETNGHFYVAGIVGDVIDIYEVSVDGLRRMREIDHGYSELLPIAESILNPDIDSYLLEQELPRELVTV